MDLLLRTKIARALLSNSELESTLTSQGIDVNGICGLLDEHLRKTIPPRSVDEPIHVTTMADPITKQVIARGTNTEKQCPIALKALLKEKYSMAAELLSSIGKADLMN